MGIKEWRQELRSAVYRGDGDAVVRHVRSGPLPDDALQLVGDGLLAALIQGSEGATEIALECVRALRARDCDGDDELAEHLEAVLGRRPTPMLRPLPVDLGELGDILEGDPLYGGGRIDKETGEVWHRASIEYALEMGEEDPEEADDPERWLWVECDGSHAGYRDMEEFIATVRDPGRADRLDIAIRGSGAFRHFKDVLGRWPEEVGRWYCFSEERLRAERSARSQSLGDTVSRGLDRRSGKWADGTRSGAAG